MAGRAQWKPEAALEVTSIANVLIAVPFDNTSNLDMLSCCCLIVLQFFHAHAVVGRPFEHMTTKTADE